MEEFRDIPGWEGYYQVSNLGNVKSLDRLSWNGKVWHKLKGRVLKSTKDREGYLAVSLTKNNSRKVKRVHQLVAMAFLDHKPNGYKLVVNHINFIRDDNKLENLEVVTQRQNTNHRRGVYSSKYPGVSWCNTIQKWVSAIRVKKKGIRLGAFDCEELAREYYENAVIAIRDGKDIVVKRAEYSSKHEGVSWHKCSRKWIAYTYLDGKQKYLGLYKTEEDAYAAQQKAVAAREPATPSPSI